MRDLRFPVATVVAMLADGMTVDEILGEHPDLEAEDIADDISRTRFEPSTDQKVRGSNPFGRAGLIRLI